MLISHLQPPKKFTNSRFEHKELFSNLTRFEKESVQKSVVIS